MKRVVIAVVVLSACVSAFSAEAVQSKQNSVTPDRLLPDSVVACSYMAGFVSSEKQSAATRCPEIVDSISKSGAGAIAFSHLSFIIQAQIVGNTYGFLRYPNKTLDQSGVPFMGLLFVTDPIPDLGNKVVIIFSDVHPERTFILALDDKLKAAVLYDSLAQEQFDGWVPMGAVYQVKGKGRFLLQERRIPGEGLIAPSNRSFVLDVSHGFKLTLARDKAPKLR